MKKILLTAALSIAVSSLFGCGGGGVSALADKLSGADSNGASSTPTGPSPAAASGLKPPTTTAPPTAGNTAAATPTPGAIASATPTAGTTVTTTTSGTPASSAITTSSSTQAAAVAGLYQGSVVVHSTFKASPANSLAFSALVLPDGRYVGLYSVPAGGAAGLGGLLAGVGTAKTGSFSGNGTDYNADSTVSQGTLSLSTVANTNLSGVYTEPAGTLTVNATVVPAAQYVFNRAPAISEFVGAWAVSTMSAESLTITFAANNTLTGVSGSCTFTGTLTPNVAGKNVFEVLYTFGSGCAAAGRTGYGVAFSSLMTNGHRQITLTAIDSASTFGDVFIGTR